MERGFKQDRKFELRTGDDQQTPSCSQNRAKWLRLTVVPRTFPLCFSRLSTEVDTFGRRRDVTVTSQARHCVMNAARSPNIGKLYRFLPPAFLRQPKIIIDEAGKRIKLEINGSRWERRNAMQTVNLFFARCSRT